MIIMLLGQP